MTGCAAARNGDMDIYINIDMTGCAAARNGDMAGFAI